MKIYRRVALALLLPLAACSRPSAPPPGAKPPIRVAVIGGMTTTGMWQGLVTQFTAETGWKVETVITGNKETICPAFRQGLADLITVHSSDEATDLVADGFGREMKPWTRNEQSIIGPPADPAHIRGLKDGAEALRRIATAHAPYVDFASAGSRQVTARLWEKVGLVPQGDWVLKDESPERHSVLQFAAQHGAYVIAGRIPVLQGKIPAADMEILVQGDPAMRRPFMVIQADPARFPHANIPGAKALADYLVSPAAQAYLRRFAEAAPDGLPLFFPLEKDEAASP